MWKLHCSNFLAFCLSPLSLPPARRCAPLFAPPAPHTYYIHLSCSPQFLLSFPPPPLLSLCRFPSLPSIPAFMPSVALSMADQAAKPVPWPIQVHLVPLSTA